MAKPPGWPGLELAGDLQCRHVKNAITSSLAAGDIELGVVGIEMHVARTPPDLDVVDQSNVVGLLVLGGTGTAGGEGDS
jgi:hypothetical protein